MHKLLARQLRKHFGENYSAKLTDNDFEQFCQAIDSAYVAYDNDRDLLERSLELSSRELNEKNSDLQRAQHSAETASKAKSSFLANMSHEMRTPLNAIIGYSELLIEELSELTHEEISEELDKIRTSGNHLLGLINNVLDLAKIESGHMEVNWEDVDVGQIIRETCTILHSQALKNKNKLIHEIHTDNCVSSTDKAKLRQILINLTGNALKFTQNGTVTISVDASGDEQLTIRIKDTGIGINPEKLKKLFQPFVQAEQETQKKFGGTGLGLAICKRFAELMQSQIDVKSKEGEGTEFILTLNRGTQPQLSLTPSKPQQTTKSSKVEKDQRILVIDDDANAIDLMRRFLGRHGYECISLKTGAHALEEAKILKPSAILLDVFLPELDGWTILSRLKEDPETRNIPVIFTTMTDERSLGLSLGAIDYFTKPIDWSRLATVLKSFNHGSSKPQVLLTEGDPNSRGKLLNLFAKNDWEIIETENTEQFKRMISENQFDLIILDSANPNLDPTSCINALNEVSMNQSTPVLYCSNEKQIQNVSSLLQGRFQVIMTESNLDTDEFESSLLNLIQTTRKTEGK